MLGVVFYPVTKVVVACVIILHFSSIVRRTSAEENLKNKNIPNISELSRLEHGTELVVIENSINEKRAYRLEDFFWTGSGDGSPEEWSTENPTTIFETKTILSTIYVTTPTYINQTHQTKCPFNCGTTLTPGGEIAPTPTYNPYENNTEYDYITEADRQFWLLTVLRGRGRDPVKSDLRQSLEKLYRTAFQRQQEYHLGIQQVRNKRNAEPATNKPVNVYIHNITKSPINGSEKIDVLYHVAVSGQPVSATAAAADMDLVSDEEVTNELGYPFIIKAEPYLKVGEPQYLSSSNNTWVFIGVALTILFTLLLLVALLTLAMSKRSNKKPPQPTSHKDVGVNHHGSFITHETENAKYQAGRRKSTPTYINFRSQPSNCTLKSGAVLHRPSSTSSSSSFSITSLDLTPLMSKKQPHTPLRNLLPRPKAAINKTAPMRHQGKANLAFDSDSSSNQRQSSADTILIKNYDPGVISPKSYLSMPSVKSFPRGSIPEPLNKVLEPVSVLHLDIVDDEVDNTGWPVKKSRFIRHGSLNTVEDPGVIGPVVWSEHCKRLQHGVSVDEGINDINATNNTTRMRKRFHDLLDDTFSLFGSERDFPVETEDEKRAIPVEVKSHSAITNRMSDDSETNSRQRPKTSVPHRPPLPSSEPPRGAWYSKNGSPLARPLSAGPCQRPQVDVNRILATATLHPNDPAVPLIDAIKAELGKCSLPGSTTDLKG